MRHLWDLSIYWIYVDSDVYVQGIGVESVGVYKYCGRPLSQKRPYLHPSEPLWHHINAFTTKSW